MTIRIPFYQHDLGEAELAALRDVFAGPILTTGNAVHAFEGELANYLGRGHVVGLSSCTGALHLALAALGIGAGDEVITTPLSYVASATAILQAGATPVFVDVERATGNLSASAIEAAITERTRAVLPVHLYGQMCDMKAIREVADKHGLFVVEDCAHALEGRREGVGPGKLSDAACFSFYATKNITCGEGGALAADDPELARRVRLLSHHGVAAMAAERQRDGYKPWDMTDMGWKYNMSNIQAAILLPQMPLIAERLARRDVLWAEYDRALSGMRGLSRIAAVKNARHARHLYTVLSDDPARRDAIVAGLFQRGVMAMVNYSPIHLTSYFRNRHGYRNGDFPIAEDIGTRTISLPFYPSMPREHVAAVADALRDALDQA